MKDTKEQRAWYFYDWANSAYVTTTTTVLFGPYLTSVAKTAAGCTDGDCPNLKVLGLQIAPGSLFFYVVTLTTVISAFLLPLLGAYADLRHDKQKLMGKLAWVGATAAALMFFVSGSNWQLGVLLLIIGNLSLGGSLVVYDALLCDLAEPDDRDRVSSRGWAFGYAGGGLLLIVNLAMYMFAPDGMGELAIRTSLLMAGLWWAGWTLVPYLQIKNTADAPHGDTRFAVLARNSFGQLRKTLGELSHFPETRRFLVAYLFFNDGVQTVIAAASIYAIEELGLSDDTLIVAIVIVQLVALVGALATGRMAARIGAFRTILNSLVIWTVVVIAGYFLPSGMATAFFLLAAAIGFVLGGTQALSRSLFSQLVPREREAEYFALYQAFERGTSWLGTLGFGLIHQLTGSYRPAIVFLIVFFIIGGAILRRTDVKKGIADAGNPLPVLI